MELSNIRQLVTWFFYQERTNKFDLIIPKNNIQYITLLYAILFYKMSKIFNEPNNMKLFFCSLGLNYQQYLTFDQKLSRNKKLIKKDRKTDILADELCYVNLYVRQPLLYVKHISNNIGYGLFAGKIFLTSEYVGEFAGIVTLEPDPISYYYNYRYSETMLLTPRKYGNELQFANHSKNSNVAWKHIIGTDKREHVIFVAVRTINIDDEILVDYGDGYWDGLELTELVLWN